MAQPLPLRQLTTQPPRMVVGVSGTTLEQRWSVIERFNKAVLAQIQDFADAKGLKTETDFSDACVQNKIPVISFRCSDHFASALIKARLAGVVGFIKSGFAPIPPVQHQKPH